MRIVVSLITGVFTATLCVLAQAPAKEAQGIAPRATAADYQYKAQAGSVTIAAEFLGHSIPTAQGALVTEDYVVVEVAFYGGPEARTTIAASDFSLRINGKKAALPGAPFGLVFSSLKDPEWTPPVTEGPKSKTSVGGGGGGGGGNEPPPPPPKMSFPERRAMEQKVQKSALPEGDRALPQAGLIFFQYRGKAEGIQSLELQYNGKSGKATLALR